MAIAAVLFIVLIGLAAVLAGTDSRVDEVPAAEPAQLAQSTAAPVELLED